MTVNVEARFGIAYLQLDFSVGLTYNINFRVSCLTLLINMYEGQLEPKS